MTETEIQREKRTSFIAAFCSGGLATHQCECGKQYYNAEPHAVDWEEGELERLEKGDAVALQSSVGELCFEGKSYVAECECWHGHARKFMGFLDSNAHKLALYFSEEKARKERDARTAPLMPVE